MPKPNKSEKVPKDIQLRFEEIRSLTDKFCDEYLNAEYKQLCRQLAAALCRKQRSPVVSGKANTWAAGIIHALGMVNFLYDPSQTPHIKATQIYDHFGIGQSTGQAKSKQIRDLMNIDQLDTNWCLPSRLDEHPLAWMISVNGYIIDARRAPRPIQEEAFRKGFIPYIPGTKN